MTTMAPTKTIVDCIAGFSVWFLVSRQNSDVLKQLPDLLVRQTRQRTSGADANRQLCDPYASAPLHMFRTLLSQRVEGHLLPRRTVMATNATVDRSNCALPPQANQNRYWPSMDTIESLKSRRALVEERWV